MQKPFDLRHERRLLWLLIATLALGFVLRAYKIDQEGFWQDEIASATAARGPLIDMFRISLNASSGGTPLDYIVAYLVAQLVSSSEAVLRLTQVVFGVLAIALLYWLGQAMFDRTTGLLAAFWLAIMPLHVYYSREARTYSFSIVMILLSFLALHGALRRNTRGAWRLFLWVQTLALYSHYYMTVITVLQGLWMFWATRSGRYGRSRFVAFRRMAVLALLLFSPWFIADQIVGNTPSIFSLPDWVTFFSSPFFMTLNSEFYREGVFVLHPIGTLWAAFAWLVILVGLSITVRRWRPRSAFTAHFALLILTIGGGIAAVVALDLITSYFWAPRQFVLYTPLILLAAAAALLRIVRLIVAHTMQQSTLRLRMAAAAVVGALISAALLWQSLTYVYQLRKEDWRGAARYMLHHALPEDAIVTIFPAALEYYSPELMDQMYPLPRTLDEVQEIVRQHPRTWILYHDVGWPPSGLVEWLNAQGLVRLPTGPGVQLYMISRS